MIAEEESMDFTKQEQPLPTINKKISIGHSLYQINWVIDFAGS